MPDSRVPTFAIALPLFYERLMPSHEDTRYHYFSRRYALHIEHFSSQKISV
jgi:hypothetical protein